MEEREGGGERGEERDRGRDRFDYTRPYSEQMSKKLLTPVSIILTTLSPICSHLQSYIVPMNCHIVNIHSDIARVNSDTANSNSDAANADSYTSIMNCDTPSLCSDALNLDSGTISRKAKVADTRYAFMERCWLTRFYLLIEMIRCLHWMRRQSTPYRVGEIILSLCYQVWGSYQYHQMKK